MGERGPLPKAAAAPHLSVVEGDTSHRPAKRFARLPPIAPDKPRGLSRVASAKWDEIVEILDRAGMVSQVDGAALELAVTHFAIARQAAKELAAAECAVDDEKNRRQAKHPAAQVLRDNSAMFLEYAKQIGLTYASRARVPAPGGGDGREGSPFD